MNPEERKQFIADISEALGQRITNPLSDKEVEWVRLAIQKEVQTIEFRKAVIEKTLTALLTAGLLAICAGGLSWFYAHIYRP